MYASSDLLCNQMLQNKVDEDYYSQHHSLQLKLKDLFIKKLKTSGDFMIKDLHKLNSSQLPSAHVGLQSAASLLWNMKLNPELIQSIMNKVDLKMLINEKLLKQLAYKGRGI